MCSIGSTFNTHRAACAMYESLPIGDLAARNGLTGRADVLV